MNAPSNTPDDPPDKRVEVSRGVTEFALATAVVFGLGMVALAAQRRWFDESLVAGSGLPGQGMGQLLIILGCALFAAWLDRRPSRRVAWVGGVVLSVILAGLFAWAASQFLSSPLPVIVQPSWQGIVLLLFAWLVVAPPPLHHSLLLVHALLPPLWLAVRLVAGGLEDVSFSPDDLGERMLVFMAPTWICALLAAVLVVRREQERAVRDRMAGELAAVTTQLREADGYQLQRRLAADGRDETWQARHRLLPRPVALKLVGAGHSGRDGWAGGNTERLSRRSFQEAKLVARLTSPHTARVHDHGRIEDGRMFQARELLQGVDLAQLVKRLGPQPPDRVVSWLLDVCDSLAEAHSLGLVHRELGPANLCLCLQGAQWETVKVQDYGLAADRQGGKLPERDDPAAAPHFTAPEVVPGGPEPDARADLYSLGCVAWFLLTGKPVPTGATSTTKDQPGPSPSLAAHSPVPLDPRLVELVGQLLAKNPEARPESAAAVADRLGALQLPRPSEPLLTPELLTPEDDYLPVTVVLRVRSRE